MAGPRAGVEVGEPDQGLRALGVCADGLLEQPLRRGDMLPGRARLPAGQLRAHGRQRQPHLDVVAGGGGQRGHLGAASGRLEPER